MVTEENEAKDKKKSATKKVVETPKNLNAPRSSEMKLSFAGGEGEAPQ